MIDKWLHIEELGGDLWVLPIWSSVNDALQKGKIKNLPAEVYELGVYISTRLNILPRIVKRINAEVTELFVVAEKHEEDNVFTKTEEGRALRINNDLKYNIIGDIDSLLFEINSACELIKQNPSWFSNLDQHRNFFIHNATPYIAIDISSGPGNYELLIMKENLKDFKNKEKFITFFSLNEIVQGFLNSKPIIQDDLVNLFKAI